jgi:hypothetical protein
LVVERQSTRLHKSFPDGMLIQSHLSQTIRNLQYPPNSLR